MDTAIGRLVTVGVAATSVAGVILAYRGMQRVSERLKGEPQEPTESDLQEPLKAILDEEREAGNSVASMDSDCYILNVWLEKPFARSYSAPRVDHKEFKDDAGRELEWYVFGRHYLGAPKG